MTTKKEKSMPASGCVVMAAGFLGAILVLLYQAFEWLRTGHWPSLTMTTLAPSFLSGDLDAWFVDPKSWYGLHAIIKLCFDEPLWLWIIGCSLGLVYVLTYVTPAGNDSFMSLAPEHCECGCHVNGSWKGKCPYCEQRGHHGGPQTPEQREISRRRAALLHDTSQKERW